MANSTLNAQLNDTLSENNDTVGHIVHCIMKNEANSDALKAMIHENSIDSEGAPVTPTSVGPSTPPMTPVSPGAPAGAPKHTCSHLHTIGGLSGHKNICTRCSQKKWPLMRKPSARKPEQRRSHLGEVTVLSVGRNKQRTWIKGSYRKPDFQTGSGRLKPKQEHLNMDAGGIQEVILSPRCSVRMVVIYQLREGAGALPSGNKAGPEPDSRMRAALFLYILTLPPSDPSCVNKYFIDVNIKEWFSLRGS
nr:RELT-like protein 1 isoform X2 [Nothobranchius furzeri]